VGWPGHPMHFFVEEYEKVGNGIHARQKFSTASGEPLKSLSDHYQIASATAQVDDSLPVMPYYPEVKRNGTRRGLQIIRQLGFNFEAGRQDLPNILLLPAFNPNDVRITTRVDENDFSNMLWSYMKRVMAFYEQGLPGSEYGLLPANYASPGIHESQSRLLGKIISGEALISWHLIYQAAGMLFRNNWKA